MKLSILIPTWNSEKYIRRAVKSIIENGHEDFELLIMDNNSNDSTKKICESFNDKRLKFLSRSDKSMYEALNRGINLSTGELVAWIGCDDRYERGAIPKVVDIFRKNRNIKWIVGEGRFVYENHNNKTVRHHLPCSVTPKNLLTSNLLISPSVVFRKEFFKKVGGFNERYRLAADYDLWLRFVLSDEPDVIHESVSLFSYNSANASSIKKIDIYMETLQILNSIKKKGVQGHLLKNKIRMVVYITWNSLKNLLLLKKN